MLDIDKLHGQIEACDVLLADFEGRPLALLEMCAARWVFGRHLAHDLAARRAFHELRLLVGRLRQHLRRLQAPRRAGNDPRAGR